MKSLLLATSNRGKISELKELLAPKYACVGADQFAPKVVEDGKSYRENVLKKAIAYYEHYQCPVLADDSGIEVDALGGGPGVDSALLGGEDISWPSRCQFLLREIQRTGTLEPWTARFRCTLCYYDGKITLYFEGTCEGKVVLIPEGTHGFGFDPVFYSTELKKTFGEATAEEKGLVSHRARAAKAFLART